MIFTKHSQPNYQGDYAAGADNAAQIAAVYFKYDKTGGELDDFVSGYSGVGNFRRKFLLPNDRPDAHGYCSRRVFICIILQIKIQILHLYLQQTGADFLF